jgi:peptidyl-prolyl cis-trans isomerase B (cyclophilin B)
MPNNKQRRDAERRRLQRQLQRRAQREARRRRVLAAVSVAGVLAVVAVIVAAVLLSGSDDNKPKAGGRSTPAASATPSTGPSSTASSSAAPVKAYPCTWKKSGTAAKKVSVPSTTKPPRKGTARVAVQTSQGAMTFTLNRAAAPCAVASFVSLAQQHYFDNTSCHRLTSGGLSVLQCGDPTGTGGGGPGYEFGDELTGKEKYTRGVLAMANAGANTNGSQFFIVYKDSQLGPNYTIFGTVSRGLNVVDKVAAKGSTPANDGKPNLPIKLQKLTVKK